VHLTKDSVLYALQSTMFQPGSSPLYDNSRGPNVQGKSNEVGAKCAFLDGRISATISGFKMALTNQAVLGPGLNVANQSYFIPVGSTTTHGFDGNVALQATSSWDFIATFYKGTVRTAENDPVGSTFENSWTAFTRYKFARDSIAKGLTIGGGVSKQGGNWISSGGIIAPAADNEPSLIKMHMGAELDGFLNYTFNKHVEAKLGVTNILDNATPVGQQGDTFISPDIPTTVNLQVTYTF
jgi:outer-membrane receptor for ferric coprogen and ferric-rhodotorulic acid